MSKKKYITPAKLFLDKEREIVRCSICGLKVEVAADQSKCDFLECEPDILTPIHKRYCPKCNPVDSDDFFYSGIE